MVNIIICVICISISIELSTLCMKIDRLIRAIEKLKGS